MLRVNTRVETQGDRTGGEDRLNRASEAALVTHLDGLRGLTPAPKLGAAIDCYLGRKPPGLFSGQGFYQAAGAGW